MTLVIILFGTNIYRHKKVKNNLISPLKFKYFIYLSCIYYSKLEIGNKCNSVGKYIIN